MDEAGYKDTDGDGVREDKSGKPIKLRLWARDISPESQVQGKLIAGWLKEIGLDIEYSVVDEGALGDSIWNYKGDTYAPDYDLALWDFMGYIDPGDSAACFTTDQIENYNEMNWSNAEYDKLTVAQYREMDTAKRMELLKQAQGVMYAEQPMIVIDYPSVLQAVDTSRWEGWQPYVGGSVWNNFLDRQSYIELKPKVAAAAAGDGGGSSSTIGWIIAGVVAFIGAFVVVCAQAARARARGRGMSAPGPGAARPALPGDYHVHTAWSDGTGQRRGLRAGRGRRRPAGDRHRRPHLADARARTRTGGCRSSAWTPTSTRCARRRRGTTTSGCSSGSRPSTSPGRRPSSSGSSTPGRSRSSCSACTSWTGSPSTTRPCATDPRWDDPDALLAAYYRTVRRAAEWGRFDVLAHIDYIGLWGHRPGPGVLPEIDAALDALAASGAALELNTDRISDPAGVMYPSPAILRAAQRARHPAGHRLGRARGRARRPAVGRGHRRSRARPATARRCASRTARSCRCRTPAEAPGGPRRPPRRTARGRSGRGGRRP